MTGFISENFLLQSYTARLLYFDYAQDLPIIDYHNHLPPEDIASNRQFNNLAEAWLEDDHYKWRAMRTWGVDEHYCTGNAPAREKFKQWANVVPYTVGNPLYHWTHMELLNPFGIDTLLKGESAAAIYAQANELLQTRDFRVRGLLRQRGVEVVCTTDDPASMLEHHQQCKTRDESLQVLPTFRVDGLLNTTDVAGFNRLLNRLEQASDLAIETFSDFCAALDQRHTYFHHHGCRLSDAGISDFQFVIPDGALVDSAFAALRDGNAVDPDGQRHLASAALVYISKLNAERGWVQQLHLGALRDANSRKVTALGQGRGFDSIGAYHNTLPLCLFLDYLNRNNRLAKTVIYNLNPADNEVFSTMAANFNEGDIRGKVQHGAAWWFLDQKHGIEQHLASVSSLGLLSCFLGMLTDSRSFLSFSRHEYFRRILCNFIGRDVEAGLLPRDMTLLGDIVRRVCYQNAKEYLPFD